MAMLSTPYVFSADMMDVSLAATVPHKTGLIKPLEKVAHLLFCSFKLHKLICNWSGVHLEMLCG